MGGGEDEVAAFDPLSAHSADEWRTMYIDKARALDDTSEDLREWQEQAADLEKLFQDELAATEQSLGAERKRADRLEGERDEWKAKFMKLQATFNTTTSSLQRELDSLRKMTSEYKTQVRELEMGNDDLERNERYAQSSLAEMEERFNRATEEKIMLEHELMSKAAQEEEMQRLRDELRDVNLEVAVSRDREEELRRQLETRSSLGPSPATSPSLPGEKDESLLHLDDLTVQQKRKMAPPASPVISSGASSPGPTPPPKPYPPLANTKLFRNSTLSNSPSRIPAPRKSMLAESTASTATVVPLPLPRTRSAATQMMGEMRNKVRQLENRLNARRAVSSAFSRKKEPAVAEVENSPGWVVLSDTSSVADSSSSFVKIGPPTPVPTRPISSASRSSTEYGRGSFDRRRSIEVQSPPTSYTTRMPSDGERPRPPSQSFAPSRRPASRLSQLAESTATIRPSDTQRFARPPTPSFIPMATTGQADTSASASFVGGKPTLGRSQSVRRAISTTGSARNPASSYRPASMSSASPVPALPKGPGPALERSTAMLDMSSIPSPSPTSLPLAASRIGRPSSSAVGNARRPASAQPEPQPEPQHQPQHGRSQTPLGLAYGSYGSYERDDEQELGVGSVKEPLPGIGLGRAKAKARIPSGNRI